MIDFLQDACALLGLGLVFVGLVIAWIFFFAFVGAVILMVIDDIKNPPTEE